MGNIILCQKGENEYIRKFDYNHEVYINENISICSDISDLTEMSEISYSFDETMELTEESMNRNGVITTKKYYNTLHNLTAVDVAY